MIPSLAVEDYKIYCSTDTVHSSLLSQHADTIYHASTDARVQLLSPTDLHETPSTTTINIPLLLVLLQTRWLSSVIIYAERTTSTQDMLRKRFRELRYRGVLAITGQQTAGRGRRGNQWESPSGSLAFSMRVPVKGDGSQLVFLQYLAALAAVECLERYQDWSRIPIRIKWPNDLVIGEKKVGGILCETVFVEGVFWVTIGVGVNLSNGFPTISLNGVLKMVAPGAKVLKKETFLAAFLEVFEEVFEVFEMEGFGPLESRYLKRWIHGGQSITLENFGGRKGTVVGLSKAGFIRVRFHDKNDKEGFEYLDLEPDATSFDFSSGLIRDKR